MNSSASGPAPLTFDYQQLTRWLAQLGQVQSHRAEHYDLTVGLDPACGLLEVQGVIRLRPRAAGRPGAGGQTAGEPAGPGRATFLLNPDLKLIGSQESGGTESGGALRTITLGPGGTELRLRYAGRLPRAWVSPQAAELALYDLWFPVLSAALEPFTYRVLLKVPPMTVPAMNGRLVPLPPELVPSEHDDASPRSYLWEATVPGMDIDACVGPYLVHEGQAGGGPAGERGRQAASLSLQVYTTGDDFDLGQGFLTWADRVFRVLEPWFGPLASGTLRIIVPPTSNWGGYTRPGYIVMPSPLAAGLRDPAEEKNIALWLAHEMGHLWHGGKVLSDTVGEAWLSEGPAEFGRLVFEQAYWGEAAYRQRLARYEGMVASAVASARASSLSMREVGSSHPEMDALARRRGGLLLAELRDAIGNPALADLLAQFAADYDGKTARTDDFVAAALRAAGAGVAGLLAAYLDQPPRPGTPKPAAPRPKPDAPRKGD